MDTKKECRIPECGDFADFANCKTVVGAKQLRKALQKGTAKAVFLAENADPELTKPIEEMCNSGKISCFWVRNMQDLGRACGIEVGAAAAAVVD